MAKEWENWSGSLRFVPGSIELPDKEEDIARIICRAAEEGKTVRVAGAGHSSTPLLQTNGMLVSLRRFQGLVSADKGQSEAVIRTGMLIKDAGEAFLEHGMALENMGDINMQTVIGAMSTGTHGTGRGFPILGTAIRGVRGINGAGEIFSKDIESEAGFFRAARLSLGLLGIFTQVRLRLVPAYRLRRREWCARTDDCLANIDELIETNRNFDFYWYPRSDVVKIRTMNPPGEEPGGINFAQCVEDKSGWSSDVIPKRRTLKFDEMEYAIPAEAAISCFQEVRRRVKHTYRRTVGWRLLYRTVAPDDADLSFTQGSDVVTISLHQNNTLPFQEYFLGIEPIFLDYGGRPHWAKKHSLSADRVAGLYPGLQKFLELRRRADPEGIFINPYLRGLLGIEGEKA